MDNPYKDALAIAQLELQREMTTRTIAQGNDITHLQREKAADRVAEVKRKFMEWDDWVKFDPPPA